MTLTHDKFLGGRLVVAQPCDGYRAGVDPVLLAASVSALAGQTVLELGVGSGVGILCLATRVPNLRLYGVEIQPFYAGLAAQNSKRAGQQLTIAVASVQDPYPPFADLQFDHVLMNPPYFKSHSGMKSDDTGRGLGRAEHAPIQAWLELASKRTKPKGYLTLVQRMERLPDVLRHLPPSLGSIKVQPLCARVGRAPSLFLLQARKNGRAEFEMLPAVALHKGDMHLQDAESYTDEIRAALRDGAAFGCFG